MTTSDNPEWWSIEQNVRDAEEMLLRAGALDPQQVAYFREKPWKWGAERRCALRIESAMRSIGIVPSAGAWSSTALDLLRHSARGEQPPALTDEMLASAGMR